MRPIALIILALAFGCSQQNNYSDPCTEFDAIDREMLNLIEQIEERYANDPLFKPKFTMVQVYWIQYRDSQLRALYPKDWDRHYREEYGREVFNQCKCQEMVRLTKLRIEELQLWLDPNLSDQIDCPSLRNK